MSGTARKRACRSTSSPLAGGLRFSWFLIVGLAAACQGQGSGQISGTAYLRSCNVQDDSAPMPSPLPAFALDPQYFYATPIYSIDPVTGRPDDNANAIDSLVVRLQRNDETPERVDYFELLLHDVTSLMALPGAIPLTVAPLTGPSQPLPSVPGPYVEAALNLNDSCPYAEVQPAISGSVRFTSLGLSPGDLVSAELTGLTLIDQRGVRDGLPVAQQAAAGSLSGSFAISVQLGSASTFL